MHIIWNLVSSSIGMNWDVIQACNRTTWNLSQAAAGFRFESLDLGFQLRGIFQDIVVAPVSQGGGPATCAVSRHNTFSLSYFVFITWPLPPANTRACRLPGCLWLLYSLITQLIRGHSCWCWLLPGHTVVAEVAHTGTASHFSSLTHTLRDWSLVSGNGKKSVYPIQHSTLLKPMVGKYDVVKWFSFANSQCNKQIILSCGQNSVECSLIPRSGSGLSGHSSQSLMGFPASLHAYFAPPAPPWCPNEAANIAGSQRSLWPGHCPLWFLYPGRNKYTGFSVLYQQVQSAGSTLHLDPAGWHI